MGRWRHLANGWELITAGLVHSACIEQGKRPSSNMPDQNFVQSENFCFPPNYFFIFTCFIIFVDICKSLNGVFWKRTYSKPLPFEVLFVFVQHVFCIFISIYIVIGFHNWSHSGTHVGWGPNRVSVQKEIRTWIIQCILFLALSVGMFAINISVFRFA